MVHPYDNAAVASCRAIARACVYQNDRLQGTNAPIRSAIRTCERPPSPGGPWLFERAAWSLAERGEFAEAIGQGQDALANAETTEHPHTQITANWVLAYIYILQGAFAESSTHAERALAIARQRELSLTVPFQQWFRGFAYARAGRLAEGLPLLRQAVEEVEQLTVGAWLPLALVHLGEAFLLDEQVHESRRCAERALALACQRGQRGYEAQARCLLGDASSHGERPDIEPAADHHRQALALTEELGMRPLGARCRLGLGALYRRAGDPEPARSNLETAVASFHAMGMSFWAQRAQSELTLG